MNKSKRCGVDGCERPFQAQGLCQAHYYGRYRTGDVGPAEFKAVGSRGAGTVNAKGYRYIKKGNRSRAEHRIVMEAHLGRALCGHETIHHINGDRLDNRLENLELWSLKQPRGQRVVDKLAWAREIIALYDKEEL